MAELEYALNKVGCKALILAPSFKTSDYVQMLTSLAPELSDAGPGKLTAAKFPDLRLVICLGDEARAGMFRYAEIRDMAGPASVKRLETVCARLQPDDAINIQFTSGTTGFPKGATLTHHNILNNGYFTARAMRIDERDRLCIPVPLYHCFGMVLGNLACITHGAAMVFPDEAFEPGSSPARRAGSCP